MVASSGYTWVKGESRVSSFVKVLVLLVLLAIMSPVQAQSRTCEEANAFVTQFMPGEQWRALVLLYLTDATGAINGEIAQNGVFTVGSERRCILLQERRTEKAYWFRQVFINGEIGWINEYLIPDWHIRQIATESLTPTPAPIANQGQNYNYPVLGAASYQNTTAYDMYLQYNGYHLIPLISPDEVLAQLRLWRGRNLWDNRGNTYVVPSDHQRLATLVFTLDQNSLDGIVYFNDQAVIDIIFSPSQGEAYIRVIKSWEHNPHMWAVTAIPTEQFYQLLTLFQPPAS